jgi:hypothetical protein
MDRATFAQVTVNPEPFRIGFFLSASATDAATLVQHPNYVGLTTGLVDFWSFAGGTIPAAGDVADLSGKNNHGTTPGQNAAQRVKGKICRCQKFFFNTGRKRFRNCSVGEALSSYQPCPGSGRYTDVWARRHGRWLAVSAHVTRC